MKTLYLSLLMGAFMLSPAKASEPKMTNPSENTATAAQQSIANAYQFSFETIDGKPLPLSDFKGRSFLVVNTASLCGFTKQYEGLEKLYQKYKEKGFSIIGVPCNDFGSQEPKDEKGIKEFVKEQFGVTFPITKKYSTKGEDAHPFFAWAASEKKGGMIFSKPRWNFHKFLIDQNGDIVKSFGSQVEPLSNKITNEIDKLYLTSNE